MKSKGFLAILFICLMFSSISSVYSGNSVVGSKHDLQFLQPKMASSYNQYGGVCVYCHTPHGANTGVQAPLWNRQVNSPSNYSLYNSTTMDNPPTTVSGISLACLSCHDGTIAVDSIINAPGSGFTWSGTNTTYHRKMSTDTSDPQSCAVCHNGVIESDERAAFLGTDLSNDHPISMSYPSTSDFNTPPNSWGWSAKADPNDVKLYAGKVECASCHNVHDPTVIPFLRKSNSGSGICKTCHIK